MWGWGKEVRRGQIWEGSGDLGGAQRDKDPGELVGDLGRGVALQGERKGKGSR